MTPKASRTSRSRRGQTPARRRLLARARPPADGIAFDAAESVIGPYETRNRDGSRMRAISVLIRDDWQEWILAFLHSWLAERQLTLGALTHEQKKELAPALYRRGAFEGRRAADYLARLLDMGRATVFNGLKTIGVTATRKRK